jgi:mono/diheme cytochrome c family protein
MTRGGCRFAARVAGVALLIAVTAGVALRARQAPREPLSSLAIHSMYGQDLYEFYCASCHGRDGKGAGPVAPALKTAPPDLTTISRRNDGVFPKARIEAIVAGTPSGAMAAHGSKDMPVWGPIFRSLDPANKANRERIANIVAYLESLQRGR